MLTPCGPLRALVNLMQERRDPLPGLLYEANVGGEEDEAEAEAAAAAAQGRRRAEKAAAGVAGAAAEGGGLVVTESPLTHRGGSLNAPPAAVAVGGAPKGAGAEAPPPPAAKGEGGGEEAGEGEGEEEEGGGGEERSIKLGLGDFVFYSVLVSRAALFDASTLAACFITVLLGLAGTLALLSVFRKALPALPISILAGVVVYGLTRFAIAPCLEVMMLV